MTFFIIFLFYVTRNDDRVNINAHSSLCVCVRCESSYGGPQCDQLLDFNVLYVVPSGQKLHYVLIAAIIGAIQIAIIVAVVMCFTR